MKKLTAILIIVACLAFTGCELIYETEDAQESDAKNQMSAAPVQEEVDENAPALPKLDFTDMDFFRDGYEVVKYSRTTDGDTATFIMGGLNVKCRFVGVDTPELARDGGEHEPYAEDARDYTKDMLESADIIILERDDAAGEYDKYDRLLAWVWVDGKLLAYFLAREGLATTRYLRDDYKYADIIFEAEGVAKELERGVWER